MKAQRVRIAAKGWEGFNGDLYGFSFKNGMSEEALPPSVMRQLGASMNIEACDDGKQTGAGVDAIHSKDIKAPVVKHTQPGVKPISAKGSAPETTQSDQESTRYSREDMEKIADDKGIGGLRDIATPLGLKGRSIHELIEQILEHQESSHQ